MQRGGGTPTHTYSLPTLLLPTLFLPAKAHSTTRRQSIGTTDSGPSLVNRTVCVYFVALQDQPAQSQFTWIGNAFRRRLQHVQCITGPERLLAAQARARITARFWASQKTRNLRLRCKSSCAATLARLAATWRGQANARLGPVSARQTKRRPVL